jgi:hypothetical protein
VYDGVPVVTMVEVKLEDCPWSITAGKVVDVGATKAGLTAT